MRQNKYDDENFFSHYAEMDRSKFGLKASGEWHILKELLPEFEGKSVLDLGCGYGWHCLYASEQGAKKIIGVDISEKMLKVAREKAKEFSNITYLNQAIEDLHFQEQPFDVVISSLAFHYIKDFSSIVESISEWLKADGEFIFSVEHPIFTSKEQQDWIYDKEGKLEYWPVDHYHQETVRRTTFLGEEVIKYHRTLSTYINTLINAGFQIMQVEESYPSQKAVEENPYMENEFRRPMFLLIRASKQIKE